MKNKKQVIFLDIDGVITSLRCNGYYDFDLWAVHFILFCCKEAGAKIVMSSYWRMIPEAQSWFRDLFGEHLHIDWRTGDRMHRGLEIKEWLDAHPEIDNYVVIDDTAYDIVGMHEKQFVHTSEVDGMLFRHMELTMKLLGIKKAPPIQQEITVNPICFYTIREAKRKLDKKKKQLEMSARFARNLAEEAADEGGIVDWKTEK